MACACSTAPTFIFPCSGDSDCGAVSDKEARVLNTDGVGEVLYCLGVLGGDVAPIIPNAKAAGETLAIDGCNLDCTKKTLERVGVTVTAHIRMSDRGMEKGKTPANQANIARVAAQGRDLLAKAG